MSHTTSVSISKSTLPALSKRLSKKGKNKALAITKNGKPVLAVMNWELYESLVETLEILADKKMMEAIRLGVEEDKDGKGIPWEEAKKSLV